MRDYASVSCDYEELRTYAEVEDFLNAHEYAWNDPRLPGRQWELVQAELERFRGGYDVEPYSNLRTVLHGLRGPITTLLDVGAACGQYRDVLRTMGFDMQYTGAERSKAFIELGRFTWPDIDLRLMDASYLDFRDDTFDLVLHSGCIMHMMDYHDAIVHAIRVARKYVIFHRTPISEDYTRFYSKKAYGIPCFEVHFNKQEIIGIMQHSSNVRVTEPVAGSFVVEKL